MKLHGDCRFTQTATQYVMETTQDLIYSVHQPLLSAIETMRQENNIDLEQLTHIINTNKDCLQSLSTQHRRYKMFEENGWVKSIPVTVGDRLDTIVMGQQSVQKSVAVTYQYVPLIPSVKLILANRKIMNLLKSPRHQSTLINSFLDGSKYCCPNQ